MNTVDILITHPLKHHAFHLAAGCMRSGADVVLLTPFYKAGIGALLARLPGQIGRKSAGYDHAGISNHNVISPIRWQLRRLFTPAKRLGAFEKKFDCYVSKLITQGKLNPKIVVTLQDYMPRTVRAAKKAGSIIWSDQISNQSNPAMERIDRHYQMMGLAPLLPHDESMNTEVLSMADCVTYPSRYSLDGGGALSEKTVRHDVSYGVDPARFVARSSKNKKLIRITARANSVRKGGHLLLAALEQCGSELISTAGQHIEVVIVGQLELPLEEKRQRLQIPPELTITSRVIPHADMPELLASSDFFVMPSLSEGMSLICIEAMQAGLPMIITPYCGIDVFKDQEMGLEVTDSVESVANGLLSAVSRRSEWVRWSDNCRLAASEITWDRYEKSIEAIARGLI